ncbi:MAG: hypothetical protein ACI9TF_000249 [Paracrocinitomix sp.]|jgi:hypothetical protein
MSVPRGPCAQVVGLALGEADPYLGHIDAQALPADFSLGPTSAGKFHFDCARSLGLFVECTRVGDDAESVDVSGDGVDLPWQPKSTWLRCFSH